MDRCGKKREIGENRGKTGKTPSRSIKLRFGFGFAFLFVLPFYLFFLVVLRFGGKINRPSHSRMAFVPVPPAPGPPCLFK